MIYVGFDQTTAFVNKAGTGVYVASLVESMSHLNSGVTLQLFSAGQNLKSSKSKTLRTRLDTLYLDLLWMHIILPAKVKSANSDLLHMPANIAPVLSPCPIILTVHDTILPQNPRLFPPWQRNYFLTFGPKSARDAAHIITISESSKRDIIKTFGVSENKVSVISLAVSPRFTPIDQSAVQKIKDKYGLGKFVLTVGSIEPRKNLPLLIKSFSELIKEFPDLSLVHAGPYGWQMGTLQTQIKELGLNNSVHFLGRVSLDDLAGLYNAASVFVYPSLYEGFGLPILEAMACGCPVITSNISSMPEIGQGASILINPTDISELTASMINIIQNTNLAQDLIQAGLSRAKHYSWKYCAEETIKIYQKVLNL
jgi:glycosyltransferase involved in cell wall biosynthesis